VRGNLAHGVWASRIKRRRFILRRRRCPEHFRRACLVIADRPAALLDIVTQCHEQTKRPERVYVGGIFRDVEGNFDVALRAKIIDLVGIDFFQNVSE
jgi:hypothetical protein